MANRMPAWFCCGLLLFACSDDTAPGGQDAGNGGTSDVGTLADGAWQPTEQPGCSDVVAACSDGKDNDGDQLVDAEDPECVGPCDNDEGSFATGIPGDNVDGCKQDCFFDGNSGQGDDGCDWNLKCDEESPGAVLEKSCPYDPSFRNCDTSQSQKCLDSCRPFTPNGCDCFGCCEVFKGTQAFTIYLGSGETCTVATPENCATCTRSEACVNECDECEICLGRTVADLPESCFPSSDGGTGSPDGGSVEPPNLCTDGRASCITSADCPPDATYCLTGCCVVPIL